jgi:hypothetical protein
LELALALDEPFELRGLGLAVIPLPHHHDRCHRAGADAIDRPQRERAVRGRAARRHAEHAAQLILEQLRAAHVACRALADLDDGLALRVEAQRLVKRGDGEDPPRWNGERRGDPLQRLARQVVEAALDVLQHHDERRLVARVSLQDLLDPGQIVVHG